MSNNETQPSQGAVINPLLAIRIRLQFERDLAAMSATLNPTEDQMVQLEHLAAELSR